MKRKSLIRGIVVATAMMSSAVFMSSGSNLNEVKANPAGVVDLRQITESDNPVTVKAEEILNLLNANTPITRGSILANKILSSKAETNAAIKRAEEASVNSRERVYLAKEDKLAKFEYVKPVVEEEEVMLVDAGSKKIKDIATPVAASTKSATTDPNGLIGDRTRAEEDADEITDVGNITGKDKSVATPVEANNIVDANGYIKAGVSDFISKINTDRAAIGLPALVVTGDIQSMADAIASQGYRSKDNTVNSGYVVSGDYESRIIAGGFRANGTAVPTSECEDAYYDSYTHSILMDSQATEVAVSQYFNGVTYCAVVVKYSVPTDDESADLTNDVNIMPDDYDPNEVDNVNEILDES